MINNPDFSFPRQLELWTKEGTLKYRVDEKELEPSKLEFLKSNKEFFKSVLSSTLSRTIKIFPLSHNQKALWFLWKVNPLSIPYNISLATEIKHPVNVDLLIKAFSILTDRHAMLRTLFAELPGSNDVPCQIVLDNLYPEIKKIDGIGLDDYEIRQILEERYRLPFDLKKGPLFRITVVNKPDSLILSLNFHHIICDAISLRNLLNEFNNVYASLEEGAEVPITTSDHDYNRFIFNHLEFLSSKEGENQINYWEKQLKGNTSVLKLPENFKRPAVHQFHGKTLLFKLSGERYSHLRLLAKENNVTSNVLLFSLFEFIISKISGQRDFCVGLPVAARTANGPDDLFGYFINLLPIRCSISEGEKFADLLKESKEKIYEGLEHQDIPFPLIVEKISPERDLSRTPVFQVIFNYLNKKSLGNLLHFLGDNEISEYSDWGKLSVKPYKIFDQEGQVDLTLEIVDDEKQQLFALKYNSDVFNEEAAVSFRDEFISLADLVIKDINCKPDWLKNKGSVAEKDKPLLKINITGTFTVEPVKSYLEYWVSKFNIKPSINFPGYNQAFPQLLNPGSDFNLNKDGYNILFVRLEDWLKDRKSEVIDPDFDSKVKEFEDALSEALRINKTGRYILAFCPLSKAVLDNTILSSVILSCENSLSSVFSNISNVIVLGSNEIVDTYDVINYYEEMGEEVGHIPFSDSFFMSAATIIARKIHIPLATPFKAIAVDCDNTLWQGIVAEDGPLRVKIGDKEKAFQKFLIEQHNSGVLICLCSKNREEDVLEVFERNKGMILKRDHIAFYKINWEPKSRNLIQLAKDINIGLDSFIFFDDNPVECAEVKEHAKEVLTIQFPRKGFTLQNLRNSWVFDRLKITDEDRSRLKKYEDESLRHNFKESAKSYKEFIDGLNLQIDIKPFREEDIPRISQLTYRTNQFNFTTVRRSEAEIKSYSENKDFECFQVNLSDRFGDYGLTGVIIVDKSEGYKIDTFLLSCRVLGKGVEHHLISFLGSQAKKNKAEFLTVNFKKSSKNIPAENFLVSNFSEFENTNGELSQYNIPVAVAQSFTFDPENNDTNNIQETTGTVQESINENIEYRNAFYYGILDKYCSLDKIAKEFDQSVSNSSYYVSGDSHKQTETKVMLVWQKVLKRDNINTTDNFFDIGGHSVLIPSIVIRLYKEYSIKIEIVDLFQYPTVKKLASYIDGVQHDTDSEIKDEGRYFERSAENSDIAIIGMAGRFPGAENIEQFSDLIFNGKSGLTTYTKDELKEKGVSSELLDDARFVPINGNMKDADCFDSAFFGVTPREADFMDPQHRVFLETCYEALESAGYAPEKYKGDIGLFAGCGMNNYLFKNLFQHPDSLRKVGEFQTIINNNSDYLTTRVSYKLNLTGPSLDIQTACSTSLVSIHTACRNLIDFTCDMALAGGAFIPIPREEGYMYEAGGIFSPDGYCRPFDSGANGTLFGEGSGVVVLKRMNDAVKDRDTILGIIKGSSVNNDGSNKVGYMAPSVNGQSLVVRNALRVAGVDSGSISYIEAHGTGTNLGDPIEVTALKKAFSNDENANYCALGSVKANIGHLDAAAGVAGLIKVVLMLNNRKLPPLVNFNEPNPELQLDNSPFYINRKLQKWDNIDAPLRAGISSFGIGGTNAHCILEEAPKFKSSVSSSKYHLLPITAKSSSTRDKLKKSISEYVLKYNGELADVAFTLQQGRTHYKSRSVLISGIDKNEIKIHKEVKGNDSQILTDSRVVFMFTGQGSQYLGMAKGLYYEFDTFREILDRAQLLAIEEFDLDLLKYITGDTGKLTAEDINNTSVAQPLLFVVQYGLAILLQEFGLDPGAVIGHSIGEYAAACISGVFNFEDALKLVIYRGRLMQDQEKGAMIAVHLSCDKIEPLLNEYVNISSKNAPDINVVSGSFKDIESFKKKLISAYPEVGISDINTSHAFHSYMMEPAKGPFKKILETVNFNESSVPFITNISGTWAIENEISSVDYWVNQITETVNLSDGFQELLKTDNNYFIEVGPGNSLISLLSQCKDGDRSPLSSATSRHPKKDADDVLIFLSAVGQAWVSGVNIKWEDYYKDEERYRVPLPTYPFERRRHWIDPKKPFNYFYETSGESASEGMVSSEYNGQEVIKEPQLLQAKDLLNKEYPNPQTDIEKVIASIWEDLLGIDDIGIDDDFFDLGGHSLLASQIINRISDKLEVRLSLDSLFSASTIRKLTEVIHLSDSISQDDQFVEISEHGGRGEYPLSPEQKRLWIISQLDTQNPAYNIPFTYLLSGDLDIDVFGKSLNILFERQSVLRSSVKSIDGEPFCVIKNYDSIPVTVMDYSNLDEEETESMIQSFFSVDSRKPFDLENGPLFRLYLWRKGDKEFIFHMTVHHIVFDGWSWGIFSRELRSIYNDILNSRELLLKPLQFQYYNISNRQIFYNDIKYQEAINYWKNKLNKFPERLNLSFGSAQGKSPIGYGSRIPFQLSHEQTNNIKFLCKEENSTVFMTMLSVFGLLLNKYSNDDDICIGAPVANRDNSKIEEIIGFFVNTIILRLKFNGSLTFRELLNDTRKTTLEALTYQLPFEKLVEVLQPERKANVNPIAQVLFAFQSTPRPPLELEGIKPERILIHNTVSPFNLTFYAWEDDGTINGEIEFSSGLFDYDTVKRLKDNYVYLLDLVVKYPETQLSMINGFSEEEMRIIEGFNNTKVEYPKEKTVSELFSEVAGLYSSKPSIVYHGEVITYGQLDSITNSLARRLREMGVYSNMPVGIFADKSSDVIVGLLGILKAGGAYVPIDPEYPDSRIKYMLSDSDCKVLLIQEKYMDFEVENISKININSPESFHSDSSAIDNINVSNDIAYIMYTSGTTGNPKGSMIMHYNIIRLVRNTNYMNIVPDDNILQTSAIVFDAATLEIWGTLLNGGTLFIADKETVLYPQSLGEELSRNSITVLWLTSALFTQIAEMRVDIFSGLKYLLVGGDVLSASHINKVRKANPGLKVINGYGPTENTTFSTTYLIEKDFNHNIPIGKPISNSTAYIFDKSMNFQPIGVIGEIYLGGDGVSKGYLNRKELNEKSFVEHPYVPGERLYKTGDYGRWLSDGNIEFHGRIDNQLKIRGFRIELEEIETILTDIDGVMESVVKPVSVGEGDYKLVAFLSVSSTFTTTPEDITRRIKDKLPSYMLPSSYKFMDEFPRTINGKIDRHSLVVNKEELESKEKAIDREMTPTEKIIYDIWRESLKNEDISIIDNFFNIGGSSLLAISVFSKIESAFNIDLGLRVFFDSPRIKDLAEIINVELNESKSYKISKFGSELVTGEI